MPSLSERLGINISTAHPLSRVAQALAKAGVAKTPELMRVVGLARRKFDASSYPDASILYAKTRCSEAMCQYCKSGDPKLRPLQSAMLIEAAQANGGFFNVGVGQGKTLASFLLHLAMEANRTVILVPAQLKTKTLKTDLPQLQKHFHLPPIFEAHSFKGQSGVFVIGYEELSSTNSSDLLDKIKPDLIVADEAHKLRNSEAARTKRFLRFARKNPCKFVAMTGSAMSKSILDFAHLIELALGKNSPLPRNFPDRQQWSDCIDKGNTELGALVFFCEDTESAREGFQRRFRETPGVISTTESAAGMPIELRLFRPSKPQVVTDSLKKLSEEWAWDGEEYDQTLELLQVERQIAQGFYYRDLWPSGVLGGNQQERLWREKRNAWRRAIRARLTHSNRVGQDSPALLEKLAEDGLWTPPEWWDWKDIRNNFTPGKIAIEVDRYLVQLVDNWQDSSPDKGIIWVDSPVVGEWLAQKGIPFYGEGQDDEVNELADKCLRGELPLRTIALSMKAHGTGKNLQAWYRNLVLYPPASSDVWEQLIGRTHRPGQESDVVELDVVLASPGAETAMANALEYAKAVEETTGQPQKLNLAAQLEADNRCSILAY